MKKKSIFKTYIRPLIPFPKRKTLLRYFPSFETRNIAYLVKMHGIDTILDVGANEGQFVKKMRSAGFGGEIVSFEPISRAHEFLRREAAKDGKWTIAPRMAIGGREGEIEINIYADSSLSSAYKMLESKEVPVVERASLRRLDDALTDLRLEDRTVLLKIDVQGFEDLVLDGAPETLKRAEAVMLEVSLLPMYEHEVPYLEMLSRLRGEGFHAVYFSPVLNREKLGESTQIDAFLVRSPRGPEGR